MDKIQLLCDTLDIEYPWKIKPEKAKKDNHGWFGNSNKQNLKKLIENNGVKNILELGAWLGLSTRYLADFSNFVITIDTWIGSNEHLTPNRKDVFLKLPTLYETFLLNCWDLRDKILPMRMSTVVGMELLIKKQIEFDLIYIDADHSFSGCYNDIIKADKIKGNPIICGDDWNWGKDRPIRKAVRTFCIENERKYESDGNFWHII